MVNTNRAKLQAQFRRAIDNEQLSFPDVPPQRRHTAMDRLPHDDEFRYSRTCRGCHMTRTKAVAADISDDAGMARCLPDDPGDRVGCERTMRKTAAFSYRSENRTELDVRAR